MVILLYFVDAKFLNNIHFHFFLKIFPLFIFFISFFCHTFFVSGVEWSGVRWAGVVGDSFACFVVCGFVAAAGWLIVP